MDKLGQYLLSGTRLLFCTDGGTKSIQGSFGWVIATTQAFLWECHGRAPGWYTSSFRSEGIRQLAILVFIEAYLDLHGLHNLPILTFPAKSEQWIRITTDNKGLISRIKTGIATKMVFARATLSPKFDVLNEILAIIP
jgi:hypothetical protein